MAQRRSQRVIMEKVSSRCTASQKQAQAHIMWEMIAGLRGRAKCALMRQVRVQACKHASARICARMRQGPALGDTTHAVPCCAHIPLINRPLVHWGMCVASQPLAWHR